MTEHSTLAAMVKDLHKHMMEHLSWTRNASRITVDDWDRFCQELCLVRTGVSGTKALETLKLGRAGTFW